MVFYKVRDENSKIVNGVIPSGSLEIGACVAWQVLNDPIVGAELAITDFAIPEQALADYAISCLDTPQFI